MLAGILDMRYGAAETSSSNLRYSPLDLFFFGPPPGAKAIVP